jgi:hypothetical protein
MTTTTDMITTELTEATANTAIAKQHQKKHTSSSINNDNNILDYYKTYSDIGSRHNKTLTMIDFNILMTFVLSYIKLFPATSLPYFPNTYTYEDQFKTHHRAYSFNRTI